MKSRTRRIANATGTRSLEGQRGISMSIVLSPMFQARRKCSYPNHARIATIPMTVSVPKSSTIQRARPRNRLMMISIRTWPPRRWV